MVMNRVVPQVVFKKTKVFMEEIVYSNVQAKSCSGSCSYSCTDLIWAQDTNPCRLGCSCDDSGMGINVGDSCDPAYDQPLTTDCI
jgi:hypothetical protein